MYDGYMAATLKVQEFLRNGGTVETLTATLGIKAKLHPKYPELVHLSYDQLESPKGDPIVAECRGLILNSQADWEVIAHPFDRFGNYGEGWTAAIDWTTARVQDKLDGSLMILWHYNGVWNVSTKGSPDAGGGVADYPFTFSELFWKTLAEKYPACHADLASAEDELFAITATYMIELMSIYNRVVCTYGTEPQLALLGVRSIQNNLEVPVEEFDYVGLPIVKSYPLQTAADVMKAAEVLDPMKNEGFVVVDKSFNRCKIKSPSYVMIHHLKDGFGQRRIIRLIQCGETGEFLTYFPEYQELFDGISGKIDAYIVEIEADYDRIKHLTDRKEFAIEAEKCVSPGVLFALKDGKAGSVRNWILHSKRPRKNADDVEIYRFSEKKIQEMIGLKNEMAVVLGVE